MKHKPYYRAKFTRWMCRNEIDPDGKHPLWLRLAIKHLFSPTVYEHLCKHTIWIEGNKRTDPVVWLSEKIIGGNDEKET